MNTDEYANFPGFDSHKNSLYILLYQGPFFQLVKQWVHHGKTDLPASICIYVSSHLYICMRCFSMLTLILTRLCRELEALSGRGLNISCTYNDNLGLVESPFCSLTNFGHNVNNYLSWSDEWEKQVLRVE